MAVVAGAVGIGFAAGAGVAVAQSSAEKPPDDHSRSPPASLDRISDVSAAFRACWVPPPLDQARPGMQVTVVVSFSRSGEIIGEPRFSYVAAGATGADRDRYRQAALDAVHRCAPLHFTPGLGGALAGRPFAIRFIDNRRTQSDRRSP